MPSTPESIRSDLVDDYIQRATAQLKIITESNVQLNQIRQNAQVDGVDLDALNVLSGLLGRFDDAKVADIASNIARYAAYSGLDIDVITTIEVPAQGAPATPAASMMDTPYEDDIVEPSAKVVSVQIALALALSCLLVWLL